MKLAGRPKSKHVKKRFNANDEGDGSPFARAAEEHGQQVGNRETLRSKAAAKVRAGGMAVAAKRGKLRKQLKDYERKRERQGPFSDFKRAPTHDRASPFDAKRARELAYQRP